MEEFLDKTTVYCVRIYKEDNKLKLSTIEEILINKEVYDNFAWDKLNRWDLSYKNEVMFLSDQRQRIDDFIQGILNYSTVAKDWDNIFVSPNVDKEKQIIVDREELGI